MENNTIETAIETGIIKQALSLSLNKTESHEVITEALASEFGVAMRRNLAAYLTSVNKFPQFPTFTQVSIESANEDGTINIVLKEKPPVKETVEVPEAN